MNWVTKGGGRHKCKALCNHKAGICRIAPFPPDTQIFRLKLLEGGFVRDALGVQTVPAPNQSSSEAFTQRTSRKEIQRT